MSQEDPDQSGDIEPSTPNTHAAEPSADPAPARTPSWLWMTIIFALLAIAMGVNNAYERGEAMAGWIIAFPVLGLALALWARRRDLTEVAARHFGGLAQVAAFIGVALAAWSTATSEGWSNYFVIVLVVLAGVALWFVLQLLRLPTLVRRP